MKNEIGVCVCVQIKQEAAAILTSAFVDQVRKKIRMNVTHNPQYYTVTPGPDSQGTAHISVLDQYGMAVSVTSSINHM